MSSYCPSDSPGRLGRSLVAGIRSNAGDESMKSEALIREIPKGTTLEIKIIEKADGSKVGAVFFHLPDE